MNIMIACPEGALLQQLIHIIQSSMGKKSDVVRKEVGRERDAGEAISSEAEKGLANSAGTLPEIPLCCCLPNDLSVVV